MGYVTNFQGEITITPPISWGQIKGSAFLPDTARRGGGKDIMFRLVERERETDEGVVLSRSAVALVSTWEDEARGYNIVNHVQEVIDAYPEHEFHGAPRLRRRGDGRPVAAGGSRPAGGEGAAPDRVAGWVRGADALMDSGLSPADGYAAMDWLARTCTRVWLDAAGLPAEAARLRGLAPLLDMDAVRAAAEPLRETQTAAYIRSGVLHWSDVDACDRLFGALGAKNTALAITGYSQLDPNSRTVTLIAGYAWTAASYAAHAVPDEECRTVAGKLAASLPPGVEG